MKLLLASGNKHKLREMRELTEPLGLVLCAPEDVGLAHLEVEENGSTFGENAMLKAKAYSMAAGLPAVADDSGLCVDALGGAPGIYSARYGEEDLDDKGRLALLLRNMEQVPEGQRGAHFVSAIAFYSEGEAFVVEGKCLGKILREPKGENGFGYDPVFLYEPLGRTFGELTTEKNTISHRAKSMALFLEKMKEYV